MTEALLLDLGNVVLEVDFRRTFRVWAERSGAPLQAFYRHWQEDNAYRAHETGELSFEAYSETLSRRLGIVMSREDWLAGWNDLFVGPYPRVQQRLAKLNGRIPLFAFTNTNPTHEAEWRARYPGAIAHFQKIFVSSSMGLRKPDAAAFRYVAETLGLEPSRIFFLDDNRQNVEGAMAAGYRTAWIRSEDDVLQALAPF